MKSLVTQHRFTDLYRPYPSFSMKSDDNDCLYESEDDETFLASPFSNPESPLGVDDLVTIDFSDLFNLQRYDQDDRKEELQVILEQVRRESLESLESLETSYNYSIPIPNAIHPHTMVQQQQQQQQQQIQLQPINYPTYEPATYDNRMYDNATYEATQPPTPPPKMQRATSNHTEEQSDKIRLYEFVLQLLNDNKTDCVRWLCPTEGEFEITNSSKIAQLWGKVKKNPTMTYEKFARALRHYYKLGILINYKHKEKLRYKFSQDILLKNKNSIKY